MGEVGSGKTTFMNKICNINLETNDGGKSVTKNIYQRKSAYDENFSILDTPGTGAESDKILHALHLKSALLEGPLNCILIAIKYERLSLMEKTLSA